MDVSAEGRVQVHSSSTVYFDSSSHLIEWYPPTMWRVIFFLWSPIQMLITSENAFTDTSVQFSSVAQLCQTLCDAMVCSTPGLPVHHQLPEFTQTYVHWVSDAIQPSHPLSSSSPPSFSLSQHQVFSNESLLPMRWPKYWSFGFSICPSNEYSGLISFRKDWLNVFAVQGTLKSLL